MSIDDLKKLGGHITQKQTSRWKEQATPNKKKITFSKANFVRNAGRIRSGLQSFGEKHPNLRDPSWMLSDNPFGGQSRQTPKRHHKTSRSSSHAVHVYHHYPSQKKKQHKKSSSSNMFDLRW